MARKVALAALSIALGGIFFYAGASKIFATQEFARQIQNYGLLGSADAIIVLAVYLPWLEIVIGGALILRRLKLGALMISSVLLFVFTGALASAWVRGLDISCGCFAEERSGISTKFPELIARDLALLLTAMLLLRLESRGARFDKTPAPAQLS